MLLRDLFQTEKPVIGMLHIPPLPGSPGYEGDFGDVRDRVLRDADALMAGGVNGLVLENFGDAPFYPNRVPPHTVAFMTVLGRAVIASFPLPLGINVLRNDGRSALAIATALGAAFIRVNLFTGARLTDQGILAGEAHKLLRYRRLLGSGVLLFADVAVKHSVALGVRDLRDEVEETVSRGRADAAIITGAATGKPAALEELKTAKASAGTAPVLAGSGITSTSVAAVLSYADGLIVGTAFN